MGLSAAMNTYDILTADLGEEFRMVAWGLWFGVRKVLISLVVRQKRDRRRRHLPGDQHEHQMPLSDYQRRVKKQLLLRQLERDLEDVSERLRRSPRD